MALFNFGKKKEEEKKAPTCCCGGSEPKVEESTGCCCGSAPKAKESTSCCCGKPVDGICCIKVLGAGCKSCHEQYENAKAAVSPWVCLLRWNTSPIWRKSWVMVL